VKKNGTGKGAAIMRQRMKNWKTIMGLALPSVVSFATATFSGTINLILVGQLGATAIAIVGVANVIMYNIWALFSGIGHSVNYLVAQSFGAGDIRKGIERAQIALIIAALMSLFVLAAGLVFSHDLMRLIGGEASGSLVEGSEYLRIRFFAMCFGILTFLFHGFFRGTGDTVTPMVLSLISNIVMVVLTYAWTYGHLGFAAYGLTGAGWGFFAGEVVAFLGCLYVYFIRLHRRYRTREWVPMHRGEAKLIALESGKLGVQEASLSVAMLIFTMFVAYLGEAALAANEVALNVMSVGFMPAFAFGSTATILVGQYIGGGNPHAARRSGTDTAILGTLFLLVVGTLEFVYAEPIARIYTSDPDVYRIVASLIRVSAYLQIFDGLLNFYAGGLRGIGDTSFLLRISFIMGLLVFVPLSYVAIFVLEWGSIGAWLSLYTYLVLFGCTVMIRFYRTDWNAVRIKSAH
jgi:putative MATE family efflux protein